MSLECKMVDVFSNIPFKGNPVAVFFHADNLNSTQMLEIANWINLSETTFILKPLNTLADYRLRIFDPLHEMPFAGHPTLGSAKALLHAGVIPKHSGYLIQECEVGLVKIFIEEDGTLFFELPVPKIKTISHEYFPEICHALNISQNDLCSADIVDVGPSWLVVRLRDDFSVIKNSPNFLAIKIISEKLEIEGITIFGHKNNNECKFEVRSFAPLVGVHEDPVCGSGNGCVAAIVRREQLIDGDFYLASQGQVLKRNGRVHVKFKDQKILIGGHAAIMFSN